MSLSGEEVMYNEGYALGCKQGYKASNYELAVVISGLKTTIERLELLHSQKDAKIKELENTIEEYAVYLRSLPSERVDW